MILGCISLLFIGFQHLGQFEYIRTEIILFGFLQVPILLAVTTFWRFLQSFGINQTKCLFKIMATLRERVWKLAEIAYAQIHINMDTTVSTVYGNTEGARKGHNSKHRGKKALRPSLLFIDEIKEIPVTFTRSFQARAEIHYQCVAPLNDFRSESKKALNLMGCGYQW